MVLIFSGNANASPQIKRKVERAVAKGVKILEIQTPHGFKFKIPH